MKPDRAGNRPRAILAASTGGHLAQLVRLQSVLPIADDPIWITFDHPQSRSLLGGQRVHYVPYIAPRDFKGALAASPEVRQIMKDSYYDIAISTGAAIAAVALPIARLHSREAWYIESVSRFDGPSLTGKIVSKVPGIKTFTQHKGWADERWVHRFSVLQDYSPISEGVGADAGRPRKVFVTLGTIKPYRFDRLVDRILEVIPAQDEITWQVGETLREDLPGRVHITMPADDLKREVSESDIVISHAGVGSAMQIMDLGKCPVLVPRRQTHGEHVDDHQEQIARELANRGLALTVDADRFSYEDLIAASRVRIKSTGLIRPIDVENKA